MRTHHNGQGNVRHFNHDNEVEGMDDWLWWMIVTGVGCALIGIMIVVIYNSCMGVKKALDAGNSGT